MFFLRKTFYFHIFLCIVSYLERAYAEGWCCFPCKYDDGF